ncbi:MAG TPA: hypothetical protein VEI97_04860 [bacterium]|nr:hypothetical protein [bacterium]
MAASHSIATLPYALGIELPGGAMRTFLEVGTLVPTAEERVRFVSRLKERTRLKLRVLAKAGEQTQALGEARLSGIRLNAQGEAQLLVSLHCSDGQFVVLQITDELGKGSAEAAFRLPLPADITGASAPVYAPSLGGPAKDELLAQLLERVGALEAELEMKYGNGAPPRPNGSAGDPRSRPAGSETPEGYPEG